MAKDAVDSEVSCNLPKSKLLSLEPETLNEVVDTFIAIADACGVKERGIDLSKQFWHDTNQILKATSFSKKDKKPKVLFMEWLNPPFDAGHWITDMLEYAGCSSALPLPSEGKGTRKSIQLDWQQIYDSDPDVVIIGCCGFDMIRNEDDARAAIKQLEPLRAFQTNNIYASDGNLYFARPGPGLREGVAILARCAYDDESEVVNVLERLPFMPGENKGWSKIDFSKRSETFVTDIEDVACTYSKLHEEACLAKQDFYRDPSTGYSVFTEYAIKKRGKCCGSGCRHCPYNHENVKDKAKHIQQPAFLYEGASEGDDNTFFAPLSSIPLNSQVKILFWSGGKDSYLTLRQLVRERKTSSFPFHLILLTTFDAESRIIAHQEVPIADVVRQAKHLGVPLLGVPLRRGSGESYLSRIERGIAAIHKQVQDCSITLVFGDLHLDHIRQWRDEELKQYKLQYPLWKVPYEDLIDDLEKSGVDVTLSAVTVDSGGVLREGVKFSRSMMKDVKELGEFGEQGEFHSLAKVWSVSRQRALNT